MADELLSDEAYQSMAEGVRIAGWPAFAMFAERRARKTAEAKIANLETSLAAVTTELLAISDERQNDLGRLMQTVGVLNDGMASPQQLFARCLDTVVTVRKSAEAAIGVMASLAAAISLLEHTPKSKKAAPSDRMFNQMLIDYRTSLERARAALKQGSA